MSKDEQKELFPDDERKKQDEANKLSKEKLAELQRNARKKVEPKKFYDEDGNEIEIPF